MKSALMAEPAAISNDEPWNCHPTDYLTPPWRSQKGREKMTISVRPTASFANFRPIRALRWVFAAAAVAAAVGAPGAADARTARTARPGAFDGIWNVQFTTRAGNCSSTTACRSPSRAAGFRRPVAARSPAASAPPALFPSTSPSAHRRRAAAAGWRAIRVAADGAGSFPATAAAAPGRPRAEFRTRRLTTQRKRPARPSDGPYFIPLQFDTARSARRQNHHHLTALETRVLLDLRDFRDVAFDLVQ